MGQPELRGIASDEVDFDAADPESQEDLDAIDVMWMERLARPWHPTPEHPLRPVRCSGRVRNGPRLGRRCPHPAAIGTTVCFFHGAKLPVVREAGLRRLEAARLRLISSAPEAVEHIIELSRSSTSDAVRLKASTEILDRAGVRGGVELDVSVEQTQDPAVLLQQRLRTLKKRTIEAEVVSVQEPGDTVLPEALEPPPPTTEDQS